MAPNIGFPLTILEYLLIIPTNRLHDTSNSVLKYKFILRFLLRLLDYKFTFHCLY